MEQNKYESMTNDELSKKLNTNFSSGLTNNEAIDRLQKNGKNELPKGKVRPWYVTFLLALVEPLQIILLIAAVISVIAPKIGNWSTPTTGEDFIDFAVIVAIVIIDAILETVQGVKARKSVDALKSLSKPTAIVLRDNKQFEIYADQLVVGDVVIIEAGKYIPAELRIIESSEFTVDESILTGESIPVNKNANPIKSTTILADQTDICFMNTFAVNGRAIGVVIKIGSDTEIGKIAKTINENSKSETPLEKKLTKFSYWISVFSVLIGIIIFVSLFFTGEKNVWSSYLMIAITLAIGVIPESLSAVVSITLSVSTKRMARENVIVKKLSSVETLGSVNVICTDKTGTLTENRMTIKKVIINNEIINDKDYIDSKKNKQKELFLKALVLPNDSITDGEERIGDPTELALVDYAEKMKVDELKYRNKFKRIGEMPFDSERKLMTTLNKVNDEEISFTKGAIDELLKICNYIMVGDKKIRATKQIKEDILLKSAELSDNALRVLGFAFSDNPNKNKLESELTFLGAVGMIDPVRDSAVKAVKEAHDAGVRVVMITGDHATTALAIARELGIAQVGLEVMTSDVLESYSDSDLDRVINNVSVFARVNPEHKVRIVQSLQRKGNITSMTGDGVNDAPSLSAADIGVAMGITGTDVAKQAANVILTDDNFATIMKGVNEGRNVYQKIKRTIVFLLGVNLANVLAILILSLINHVSPLEATDILWINLIVESLLAIAMGMGPNDDSLMKLVPVKGKNGLLKGLLWPILKLTIILGGVGIASFYLGMLATPSSLLTVNIDQIDVKYQNDLDIKELTNGNSITFDNWHDLLACNKFISTSESKIDVMMFGRTSIFLTITISPAIIVHLIKLSNWKMNKKINFDINKPLLVSSLIAVTLNVILIFIPGLNDKIFNLVPIDYWNKDTIWVFFAAIGFALITPAGMVIIDAITFYGYHYKPDAWNRNRTMVNQMVKSDEQARINKEKQRRKNI